MIYFVPSRYTTPKWQAKIIPQDKQFHFCDGTIVTSLWELKQALNTLPHSTLENHVNHDKHDLADWIEFVINDGELAQALRKQTHRWGLIVTLERHMMRSLNLPPYVAKRWLSPAASPLYFISGDCAHNLEELADVLDRVSDEVVDYHLERVPNDISQWVLLNLGDADLAELLEEASNRSQMLRFVEDHIVMLKEASED